MARRYTPFNGPGGESFTTDAERMQFADAARQAAMQTLRGGQPQEADPQAGYQYNPAEFNDWQNRQREVRENQQAILGTAGDQDRQTILAGDVGKNYRTDATMKPSLMGAEDDRSLMNEGKGVRDLRNQTKEDLMRQWGNMGAASALGGKMSPEEMDQQFLAMQFINEQPMSNPADKQRARADADRARMSQLAASLIGANNPQGREMGAKLFAQDPMFANMGIDPTQLSAALAPRDASRNPDIMGRASVAGPVNRGVQNFVDTAESDPVAASQQINDAIAQAEQAAIQGGGDPEEAKAEILNRLDALVPKRSKASMIIRDILSAFIPGGSMMIDSGYGTNQARKQVGLDR